MIVKERAIWGGGGDGQSWDREESGKGPVMVLRMERVVDGRKMVVWVEEIVSFFCCSSCLC